MTENLEPGVDNTSRAPGVRAHTGLILGIESSCDETAAAVVRCGTEVLSNIVASQMTLHARHGGVVPELAAREHLRNIVPVVRAAIAEAGITLNDLDAIAVTQGPGLAGALLVGISYAQALAFALDTPLLAVNHLEGHIHAVLMQSQTLPDGTSPRSEESPRLPSSRDNTAPTSAAEALLALVVSGGHTHLYLAHRDRDAWQYRNIGRTLDDAAGEAFDKVAKLLGLGYPGGPWIDALAPAGDPLAVPFTFHPIQYKQRPLPPLQNPSKKALPAPLPGHPEEPRFDFSFSGIKTAVLRYTQSNGLAATSAALQQHLASLAEPRPADALFFLHQTQQGRTILDLIASFQHAVVGILIKQTSAAASLHGIRHNVVSGGVAANAELRRRFTEAASRGEFTVAFPSLSLATDNAAMIAAAAWPRLLAGDLAPASLTANPNLRLGEA